MPRQKSDLPVVHVEIVRCKRRPYGMQGGHLWTHMKSGFLSEPVAKIFAAEIVLALSHLHDLGIAHRDLKPENILLDSDNHLRLTDFGLAKREMSEDGRAHTMVGTIDYMAPEVRPLRQREAESPETHPTALFNRFLSQLNVHVSE